MTINPDKWEAWARNELEAKSTPDLEQSLRLLPEHDPNPHPDSLPGRYEKLRDMQHNIIEERKRQGTLFPTTLT